jgi:3D (Asp-Asp-Asp) domain-containing protein
MMKSTGYFSSVYSAFSKTFITSIIAIAIVTSVNAVAADKPTDKAAPKAAAAKSAAKTKSQWKTISMKVTAYCPCTKCCGEWSDGVTSNGHVIKPGDCFVAADSRFAFDTEMLIKGYNKSKTVKVFDRGGAIKGNKLDVFFNTHQAALEWGVRYIDVKVRK